MSNETPEKKTSENSKDVLAVGTSNGLCLPVEERKIKDNCGRETCDFYSGAIRTHCKLRDEHRITCDKYIPYTAHKGDPCQYCGTPHDVVERGRCPKRGKQT